MGRVEEEKLGRWEREDRESGEGEDGRMEGRVEGEKLGRWNRVGRERVGIVGNKKVENVDSVGGVREEKEKEKAGGREKGREGGERERR